MRRGVGLLRWVRRAEYQARSEIWIERTDRDEIQIAIDHGGALVEVWASLEESREISRALELARRDGWVG